MPDHDSADFPTCPACKTGYLVFLGALGDRDNFRCRDCGAECSRPLVPADPFDCDADE